MNHKHYLNFGKRGFPQYYREFFDLLGFKNPEVMKIIEPNLRLEEIWPDKPGNKKGGEIKEDPGESR